MAESEHPLPVPMPPSSAEIELPLSSTWRLNDGRRPTPTALPPGPQAAIKPLPVLEPKPETLRVAAAPSPATPNGEAQQPQTKAKTSATVVYGHSTCPKCGFEQPPGKACRRCGLIFAKWRPGMEAALFADIPPSLVAKLRELWTEVQNTAPEAREEALKRFHQIATSQKAGKVAGDCYRRHLTQHPDDALVEKWRNKLLFETELLLPTRAGKKEAAAISTRTLLIGLGAGLLFTILCAYLFSKLLRG